MTPERAMIYSRLMTGVLSYQNIVIAKDGGWHESAVTDLLRQAVNEALTEAERSIGSEATFWGDTDDTRAYKACMRMLEEVRALKLPEQP